ncbi:RidA family protein [Qipengyuania mesophila]|uniref:RidA family protein n=1 Tax=Qipengyuania mesophila TaxID=2867246 RepID=UPI001FFD1F1A|nr:RidA family protein [Qipengyuania mesophila]
MPAIRPILALALLAGAAPLAAGDGADPGTTHAPAPGAPVFTPSTLPYPFSTAVQVGDVLYLSGDIGVDESGSAVVPGGIEPETRRMFERIGATLAQHGLGFDDVFKCTVYLADMGEWPAFNAIYATYFEKGRYPARSAMGVSGLALGARVEMECWAYSPQ